MNLKNPKVPPIHGMNQDRSTATSLTGNVSGLRFDRQLTVVCGNVSTTKWNTIGIIGSVLIIKLLLAYREGIPAVVCDTM